MKFQRSEYRNVINVSIQDYISFGAKLSYKRSSRMHLRYFVLCTKVTVKKLHLRNNNKNLLICKTKSSRHEYGIHCNQIPLIASSQLILSVQADL